MKKQQNQLHLIIAFKNIQLCPVLYKNTIGSEKIGKSVLVKERCVVCPCVCVCLLMMAREIYSTTTIDLLIWIRIDEYKHKNRGRWIGKII